MLTNTHYKTNLYFPYTLTEASHLLTNSKLYTGRPTMLKYRVEGITILLFRSGNVRLMGGGTNHSQALDHILRILTNASLQSPLKLMSMTWVYHLPFKINLHMLDYPTFMTELELFPASKFLHNGKEHANIFSSGKVVITGTKSEPVALINKIREADHFSKCPST
jgi:TATA-box binding protein (TBP) (component of TFIID and TFIIIB)